MNSIVRLAVAVGFSTALAVAVPWPSVALAQPASETPARSGAGGASGTEPAGSSANESATTFGGARVPFSGKAPDADRAAEEEAKPSSGPSWISRFEGSAFFTQTSANLNVIAPRLQLSQNSTVDTYFSLAPRFELSKNWQVRGLATATYEWTNADETTRNHEFRLGDVLAQLYYRGLPSFWGGTTLFPYLQLGLPLSKESQARTMLVSPGAGVQIARGISHVLGGDVMLIGVASYSHPLYKYTTRGVDGTPPYAPQCFGGDTCENQVDGTANVRDAVGLRAIVTATWGKWSPGAFFRVNYGVPYTFQDLPGVEKLSDRTALRQGTYVAAWLDYEVNSWLTPELGYQFERLSVLDGDGQIGNPFFSHYQDMRLYLGANIQLDSLYKAVTGERSDEAGIVRATNERHPIIRF